MRRYRFPLTMLVLAALCTNPAHGDDQHIAEQIVQKLQAEKKAGTLKGFSIDLQVDEGTVWLSGRVANADQQAKALDIARRIPGVVQVVNDLSVAPAPAPQAAAQPKSGSSAVNKALGGGSLAESRPEQSITALPVVVAKELPPAASSRAVGSGIDQSASSSRGGVVHAAPPIGTADSAANSSPQPFAAAPMPRVPLAQPIDAASQLQAAAPQPLAAALAPAPVMMQPMPIAVPVPVYAGSHSQVPLAFAPARAVNYTGQAIPADGMSGAPMPMHLPGSGVGIAPARYDHPHMPGYAWPSYAAYPNYAAVTYPKAYSPTAWPYIGPFYPYPQVPLGWRKVTLEWDDGWWFLDFKDRRSMYNH
jgi:hypothetical protein